MEKAWVIRIDQDGNLVAAQEIIYNGTLSAAISRLYGDCEWVASDTKEKVQKLAEKELQY